MTLATPTTPNERGDRPRVRPRVMFAARRGAARRRRASDAVLLGLSAAGVGLLAWAASTPSHLGAQLTALVAALPGWLDPLWVSAYDLVAAWAVVVVVAALLARRPGIALEAIGSALLALALAVGLARLVGDAWPHVAEAAAASPAHPRFPAVRLAAEAAALASVSPALVRPLRHLGSWLILLGAAACYLLGVSSLAGVAGGVVIAVGAAATVRLVAGTTGGDLEVEDVAAALHDLGVDAASLEPAPYQPAGVATFTAQDATGGRLLVKVVGRDAYDNRLLEAMWRSIWYRTEPVPRPGLTRRHIVEHEALMTFLASEAGVPTLGVVTAGVSAADDAVLVTRGGARPLADLTPAELTDDRLREAWRCLDALHAAGLAHRHLSAAGVAVGDDDRVLVTGLGHAVVGPPPEALRADEAALLATTSALAGGERAIATAVRALGRERVAGMLPFLQPAAFDGELRRSLRAGRVDVDALRGQAAAAVDAPAPELEQLRRVTWFSLFQAGLLVLAATALVREFTSLDVETVARELRDADATLLVAAFLLAQVPRFFQALATLGAVPVALPYGPIYAMQLATGYMNLALPSSVARLAINIRFFQRQGLTPATAVASGTIDAFAGNAVQVVLLVLLLVFSSADLNPALHTPPSGGPRTVLALVIAAGVLSVLATVVVGPLRRRFATAVRRWWPDVRAALKALGASRKLAYLIGGCLATELLFAVTLGLFALALGYRISLPDLLLINLTVSLFSSLIPIPGGIGITEGGLMVGLTAAGVPQDAAFAIAISNRLATFYLPPLWGWYAMHWLQSHRYL